MDLCTGYASLNNGRISGLVLGGLPPPKPLDSACFLDTSRRAQKARGSKEPLGRLSKNMGFHYYEATASMNSQVSKTGVPHTLSGLSQTSVMSVQLRVFRLFQRSGCAAFAASYTS